MSEIGTLVERARKGDLDAFQELVTSFESFVFKTAARHGPRDEIENVSQESFLSAYTSLSKLSDPEAFPGWLHSIVVRRCLDCWRRKYRKAKYEVALSSINEKDVAENSTFVAELDRKQAAEKILALLLPEERLIMTLLYLEEKSVDEVSKLLNFSKVNVKVKAHRIRNKLKSFLERENAIEQGVKNEI